MAEPMLPLEDYGRKIHAELGTSSRGGSDLDTRQSTVFQGVVHVREIHLSSLKERWKGDEISCSLYLATVRSPMHNGSGRVQLTKWSCRELSTATM